MKFLTKLINGSVNNEKTNLTTTMFGSFVAQWPDKKQELQKTLLAGEYQFSPLNELRFPDGKLECWCAADALVLKAMTIVLGENLASVIAPTCVHVAGHGGVKKAVRNISHHFHRHKMT